MKKLLCKIVLVIAVAFLNDARAEEAAEPQGKTDAEQMSSSEQPPGNPAAIFESVPDKAPRSLQSETVDPAIVRAGMKARAEYDALDKKITARRQQIYEENPTVKKLQANMRELQKRIDSILERDEELCQLREKLDSIAPQMPFGMEMKNLPTPLSAPGAKQEDK